MFLAILPILLRQKDPSVRSFQQNQLVSTHYSQNDPDLLLCLLFRSVGPSLLAARVFSHPSKNSEHRVVRGLQSLDHCELAVSFEISGHLAILQLAPGLPADRFGTEGRPENEGGAETGKISGEVSLRRLAFQKRRPGF